MLTYLKPEATLTSFLSISELPVLMIACYNSFARFIPLKSNFEFLSASASKANQKLSCRHSFRFSSTLSWATLCYCSSTATVLMLNSGSSLLFFFFFFLFLPRKSGVFFIKFVDSMGKFKETRNSNSHVISCNLSCFSNLFDVCTDNDIL